MPTENSLHADDPDHRSIGYLLDIPRAVVLSWSGLSVDQAMTRHPSYGLTGT